MARKHPEIDIIKLMAGTSLQFKDDLHFVDEDLTATHNTLTGRLSTSHAKWNTWLDRCLANNDLSDLIRVRYGIQVGMDSAAKKKLNTDQINELFCRWIGSIDKTARKIIAKKNNLPKLDRNSEPSLYKKVETIRKQIECEFEVFIRKASF